MKIKDVLAQTGTTTIGEGKKQIPNF